MSISPAERDVTLAVPALPHTPPVDLSAAGTPLRQTTGDATHLIAGSSAWLHAGASGVDDVWCGGLHVLSGLRAADTSAEPADATRIALVRELRLPAGAVVETLFVPGGARAAVIEWRAVGDVALELSWRAMLDDAGAADLRWNQDSSGVIAARGDVCAAWIVTATSEPVIDVSADRDSLACRARITLAAGECCRLVCIAASADNLAAEIAPLREPQSLVLARVGEQRRRMRTELYIQSGDASFDPSVLWSVQRVDTHLRAARQQLRSADAGTTYDAETLVWLVLAQAAAGKDGPARELLAAMSDDVGRDCATDPAISAGSRAAFLLLAVETCAWTGDAGLARRAWSVIETLLPAIRDDIDAAADARIAVVLAAASARLPHVAELIGDAAGAQAVQPLVTRARQSAIAGVQRNGGEAAALAVALRIVEVDPNATPAREYADSALTAWAELVAGRAAGWARLGRVLAARSAARVGSDDAMRSALDVRAITAGLLGLDPDAASGRLTLRPAFPADWHSVAITGIRLGDWILRLKYEREGATHRFELTPVEGATPLTVIFEPLLPGRTLVAAHVDGTEATLDATRVGARVRVAVQIVLDHPRTIRFDFE